MPVLARTKADLNTQLLQNTNHIKIVSHGHRYFSHYSAMFNELEHYLSKLAKLVLYEDSDLDGLQFYFNNSLIKVDCGTGNTEIVEYELNREQFIETVKVVYMAAVNGKKIVFINELKDINL